MPVETYPDIIFTKVDEAPQLASASLLPIVQSFAAVANVKVGVRDISLAGRIIAAFPENLTDAQRKNDDLAFLGEVVKTSDANIIKLPNISASVPQLIAALKELRSKGYDIPKYQENPLTKPEQDIRSRFDALKGSAVNPVLREGNSDRRAATAVKNYSMANPHTMGLWETDSKTYVSTMSKDDFFTNEKSATLRANQAGMAQIELLSKDNSLRILKSNIEYHAGSVVDATFMSAKALSEFLSMQLKDTKENGVLFSIHLKATMMKISDPIIFGHAVKSYLATVFKKYAQELAEVGANANSGMGAVINAIMGSSKSSEILAAINEATDANPPLYMVNSDKGITNLHVPSDVIIDASLPALIRAGGKAWGPDGNESDTNCVIP